MCGFEEVTHEPEPAEFRPTPTPNPNMTTALYVGFSGMDDEDEALLGGITTKSLSLEGSFFTCGSFGGGVSGTFLPCLVY